MAELMLINPGRRVKKHRKSKRTVRAKRRKMSPLQLKYFGKKSQRTALMAKKRRHKKRRNPITSLAANPKRRRHLSARRRANPIRVHRRRRHRNPAGLGKFSLNTFMRGTLIPSAVGAAGALGVDMALSYLPLPDNLKTGPVSTLVKIAGAIGVGMIAGMVTNRRTGEQVTAGAVTVQLYQLMAGMLATTSPVLAAKAGLAGYGDYPMLGYAGAGINVDSGMGAYVDSGMGAYVSSMPKVSAL